MKINPSSGVQNALTCLKFSKAFDYQTIQQFL